jgi:SAM-dependent methyltransferase
LIKVWSQGAGDKNMPEAMLVKTLACVRRHPWWSARSRLALTLLQANGVKPPMPVLDIGCGWGVTLEALESAGYHATGLDVSPAILKLIDRSGRQLIEADLNQPAPAVREPYSGALLLDVIEHLDDNPGTLRRVAPLLKPGGSLIVSVPALPELFSEFDQIQGHRRRYTPETLRSAFNGSGFTVENIFWWGQWMIPILRWMRQKSDSSKPATPRTYADYLRLPPWPGSQVMRVLYAWEQGRALQNKLRTGTSLFAVARRTTE